MELANKIAVITGGSGGIGAALAVALKQAGALVAISDIDADRVARTAHELDVLGIACDVRREEQIIALIDQVHDQLGQVDIFISNAGVGYCDPSHAASAPNANWQDSFDIHVMSHVYAARKLLPMMIERGHGCLVNTASAAGLLHQIGDAAYSTTKHAAVGLAESLAIAHGDDGITVCVICPQYVATPMLGYETPDDAPDHDGLISPQDVANTVIHGLEQERFLILPHPVVKDYVLNKATDYDRWIKGMRKLRRASLDQVGSTRADKMHLLV